MLLWQSGNFLPAPRTLFTKPAHGKPHRELHHHGAKQQNTVLHQCSTVPCIASRCCRHHTLPNSALPSPRLKDLRAWQRFTTPCSAFLYPALPLRFKLDNLCQRDTTPRTHDRDVLNRNPTTPAPYTKLCNTRPGRQNITLLFDTLTERYITLNCTALHYHRKITTTSRHCFTLLRPALPSPDRTQADDAVTQCYSTMPLLSITRPCGTTPNPTVA